MTTGLDQAQRILLHELDTYRGVDQTEETHRVVIRDQVAATPLWWHRDTLPGHVTASAFVVTPDFHWLLLHFHRKLDRWLQFGGHDDGERHPAKAVLRELQEESGLRQFDFFGSPVIFDLDVHDIPARGSTPGHRHLDVRYLFVAEREQELQPAAGESRLLRWTPIADTAKLLNDGGGERVSLKLQRLSLAQR
ncbi:MAG: NUDIX hydrolase [Planctomycetota bacterium]